MKNQRRAFQAAGVALLSAISSAEGHDLNASGTCAPLNLPIAQVTAPPTQYIDFCRLNPGHCNMTGPTILYWTAPVRQTVDRVNRAVNSEVVFVPDPEWQGEEEVWSYPVNGRGDCEDFALEKRRRLVEFGLPRASMTMAIAHHKAKLSSHAVLLLETTGGTLVLDNMSDEIGCWGRVQLNYESRERPDGRWSRFDQSFWNFEPATIAGMWGHSCRATAEVERHGTARKITAHAQQQLFAGIQAEASRASLVGAPEGSLNGLLTAIATWLSFNLGLPAIYENPQVRFLPQEEIAAMHLANLAPERWNYTAADGSRDKVVSAYSTLSRTILLQDTWIGKNPAELSILVHEMVHHLQTVGGRKYECAATREKAAYEAQALALAQFGRTLKEEFGIDEMTLLARTTCSP
jgi:predicted transglutaminase-like cysteine proteinase